MSTTTNTTREAGPFDVIDLGRIGYREAFKLQTHRHGDVLAGAARPALLLLEHDPVITISRRDAAADHLIADASVLRADGVDVQPTDRGGDITYHGPGQLVVYPIVPLAPFGLNVRQYVRTLEQVVIDTLNVFGVESDRDPDAVGVWVNVAANESAKVAAIGVRVKRWVTMHGLALNVTTNLEHFKLIIPCGLHRPVASLAELLGENCPSMQQVKDVIVEQFVRRM